MSTPSTRLVDVTHIAWIPALKDPPVVLRELRAEHQLLLGARGGARDRRERVRALHAREDAAADAAMRSAVQSGRPAVEGMSDVQLTPDRARALELEAAVAAEQDALAALEAFADRARRTFDAHADELEVFARAARGPGEPIYDPERDQDAGAVRALIRGGL